MPFYQMPTNRSIMGSMTVHCSPRKRYLFWILYLETLWVYTNIENVQCPCAWSAVFACILKTKTQTITYWTLEGGHIQITIFLLSKHRHHIQHSFFANHFCSLFMHMCAVCRMACVEYRIPKNITQNTDSFLLSLKCRCYGRWSIGAMVGLIVLGYFGTCDRNYIWLLTWLQITNGFVNMLCSRSLIFVLLKLCFWGRSHETNGIFARKTIIQ